MAKTPNWVKQIENNPQSMASRKKGTLLVLKNNLPNFMKKFNSATNWKRGSTIVFKKISKSPVNNLTKFIRHKSPRRNHASVPSSPRSLSARKHAAKNISQKLYGFVKNSYPQMSRNRRARVNARMKSYVRQGSS